MRIEQLQYLVEISRHKSLNQASKALHMTPQALGMAIKQLEDELGFKLLQRSAVGTALTSEGQAVLLITTSFLDDLQAIKKSTQKPVQQLEGDIELLMPPGVAESSLAGFQMFLYENCPKSHLIIHEFTQPMVIQSVLTEKSELGIAEKLLIAGEDALSDIPCELEFVPLFHYRACCFGNINANVPVTRYKKIALKTLLEYPIVLSEDEAYLIKPIIELVCPLEKANIIWVKKVGVITKFLKNGPYLTIRFINENNNQILMDFPEGIAVPLKEDIVFQEGYLVKRDKPLSNQTKQLIQYLQVYFNQ